MLATHIAWAAGLFEGEGCISTSIDKRNGNTRYGLYLGGKDRDVIQRFCDVMGCGNIHKRESSNSKHADIYMWQVFAKGKVHACLDKLLPYFGDRRAHKALDVLDSLECT